MNDHEKFKWIIDTIGYKITGRIAHISHGQGGDDFHYISNSGGLLNLRSIIFLPCFKNTFSKYLKTIKPEETIYNSEYNKITENLSDPVGFLHNLIK